MSSEVEGDDDEEEGGAGWIMTFADLMSLLMCFFVLLLSFSEMDIQKYKQVAGSMKHAFGIQREIKSDVIPKGTSMITDKFSPGKPDPDSLLQQMRQQTTDDLKEILEVDTFEISKEANDLAKLLKEELEKEIKEGILDVILEGSSVSVRIREKDSFPSGKAALNASFYPILEKVAQVLNQSGGQIIVGGHTDSVPISTIEFPSNWVLSAARAATVVHFLVDGRLDDTSRIELRAYADTRPVVEVDPDADSSQASQAKNRRIEVVVKFDGMTIIADEAMEQLPRVDGF
ncbi:MAG: OmpA family protein [Granulosicoccus sp.]|nr:OmpA family protein [Granulosicoccus sp.]